MSQSPSPWKTIAGLVWLGFRSFIATVVGMTLLGVALAAAVGHVLRVDPWGAVFGAAIALAESVAAGIFLGTKRGLALPLLHGLEQLQLGRKGVGLVFDRILKLSEGTAIGGRDTGVARALERVPLAQAERLLGDAVCDTIRGDAEAGWLRRTLQSRLLSMVSRYTLARFRETDAAHGGVDLARVRTEIETQIDGALAAKLRAGVTLWTATVVVGVPALVAVETYAALVLLRAR